MGKSRLIIGTREIIVNCSLIKNTMHGKSEKMTDKMILVAIQNNNKMDVLIDLLTAKNQLKRDRLIFDLEAIQLGYMSNKVYPKL
jgi:hypothetical protein